MIRILIIEDEQSAYDNLTHILNQLDDEFVVVDWLQSVEQSIHWFETHAEPDLLFLDIQLSDDLSFKLFEHIEIKAPIIFTTAFNEFAIRAFEVNSVDYLLKPLSYEKVEKAILKYHNRKVINPIQYQNLLARQIHQRLVELNAPPLRVAPLVAPFHHWIALTVF